jgi:hypothetical protein
MRACDDRESVHGRLRYVAMLEPQPGCSCEHVAPAALSVVLKPKQSSALNCVFRLAFKVGFAREPEDTLDGLWRSRRDTREGRVKVRDLRGLKAIPWLWTVQRVKQESQILRSDQRPLENKQTESARLCARPTFLFRR